VRSILLIVGPALLWAGTAPALDWKTPAGFRHAELPVPVSGKTGFTLLAPSQTGILFTNLLSDRRGLTNQILMSGSGVALGDIDGDGWCDVYFCGLDHSNALYRNLGNWKFQDLTASAGVACAGQTSTGAVFADVDGDGDLDLLVTGLGRGVRLFINDGQGHFTEATQAAGLGGHTGSMSLALADIDGDGDLDLYVANYRSETIQDEPGLQFRISMRGGQPAISLIEGQPPTPEQLARFTIDPATMSVVENGEADVLYRNDGHARFTPVSWTDGTFRDERGQPVATPYDWGYSAMFRDMNGDGAPDLYVCNDAYSVDRIWINDGAGRFRAASTMAIRQTSFSSMGVDFADLNRDGFDDFFVADMLAREHAVRHTLMADHFPLSPPGVFDNRPQYAHNTLFLNRGDGTYAEIAQFSGVDASDWSWNPIFLDVDLDGYEDLLITTGLERSLRNADARRRIEAQRAGRHLTKDEFCGLRNIMPRLDTPNYAFRNRGDLTFERVSTAWGFDSRQVSQGMALADLDNDGDLDVMVTCLNAPPLLYRNDSTAPRVAVRLKGNPPNTRGIGARIKLLGGPVTQSQEMICGGRYLSADDAIRVFAAGKATNGLSLEITWRSGQRSTVRDVKPNHVYEVEESRAGVPPAPSATGAGGTPALLFSDASALLNQRHAETPFNDFERQPLLPRRLSQLGPGVSWCDLNGDGWDDLLLPSGRGGELAILLNDGHGAFRRLNAGALASKSSGGQTTALGWPSAPGAATLLVGSSNYETGDPSQTCVARYEFWAGGVDAATGLPGHASSVGALALADVDGDGDLDLFVAGRVVPGRYPEAAVSRLFRNDGGKFSPAQEFSGLVSGAVFSDLNGDGLPELILACEWAPVRVFRNAQGKFIEATETLGLGQLKGWWNSVTTGDFDGDGRMDLVAGNWGRNTKYQYYAAQPIHLYYGDLNGDGSVQLLEAHFDAGLGQIAPRRPLDALARVMPFVAERFDSFERYSKSGVPEILGARMTTAQDLTVNTTDSMLFLNRGDHFDAVPLPLEAQWSPVFGLCVGDLDGDGQEDIVVAQNFFGVDDSTARHDAGLGVWLRGDGRGRFKSMSAQESGVRIYGEGRGAALCDYDGDGRVDLVVAQNGAETKLYHNDQARPGLRVRLKGPPGNATGVGAVLRLMHGTRLGPAREVHAGSGYWSQDSAVQVLSSPEPPTRLQVRWPGGKLTTNDLPQNAQEVVVAVSGTITAIR
jgi:hypothetical protein